MRRATIKSENIPVKSTQTGIQFEKGIKISVVLPKFAQSFSPKTLSAEGRGGISQVRQKTGIVGPKTLFFALIDIFVALFGPS